MLYRWMTAIFLLSSAALTAAQAPQTQEKIDLGELLTDSKKPCDEDKKKQAAAAQAEAQKKTEQAMQGLIGLGEAEKTAEAKPKSLGAVPGPMGNCK